MKQNQRRNKRKESDKKKEPKESKQKRQEGRKKEERERERGERERETEEEKLKKGEAKKGHLTWPLNPPKNKQTKKKWKTVKNKKHKKIPKKELFSYQSIFSSFGGCPIFPFFDNLAQKARTQKTL